MLYAPVSFFYSVGHVAKIWSERIEELFQVDSLFLYSTTLHSHIFTGAYITDRMIFTSDTKEFHFHKRDFDWLIRNFEYSWKRMFTSDLTHGWWRARNVSESTVGYRRCRQLQSPNYTLRYTIFNIHYQKCLLFTVI